MTRSQNKVNPVALTEARRAAALAAQGAERRVNALLLMEKDPALWVAQDMTPPLVALAGELARLVADKRAARAEQPVAVNCSLGVARSVAVVLVWLLAQKVVQPAELEDAVRLLGGPDVQLRLKALQKTRESVCAAAAELVCV